MTDQLQKNPFPGIDVLPGNGEYISAENLLLVSDLTEMNIKVERWKHDSEAMRLRVKALNFDQLEAVERGAMVKIGNQIMRSEARFAAHVLFYGVIAPKLTMEQSTALCHKHNPKIISNIVTFIVDQLSLFDQDMIDGLVNEKIPGAIESASDATPDASDPDTTPELDPTS